MTDERADPFSVPYQGSDFYCDVALPNIDRLEVVAQTDGVLAFVHTLRRWPVHIVVLPKLHVPSLTDLAGADAALVRELLETVQRVAGDVERERGAARIVTNVGAYQDSRHLHVHVISGQRREDSCRHGA